jgi:hypothetical protein
MSYDASYCLHHNLSNHGLIIAKRMVLATLSRSNDFDDNPVKN